MRGIRTAVSVFAILLVCLLMSAAVLADMDADGKIVIAIDPGHGGIDGGSDAGTYPEKTYNMKLSRYLRDYLNEDGRFTAVLTHEEDIYLHFVPRVRAAVDAGADVLISMHCNTFEQASVGGCTAFVSRIDRFCARDLAEMLLDAVSSSSGIYRGRVDTRVDTGDSLGVYYWDEIHQWDMPGRPDLGIPSDYYSINMFGSKFGIPAIIIEHGYLSNPYDLAILDDDENLRAIARAEADAIISYYTGHEHVFGDWETDYPSNCVYAGTESRRCQICGARAGIRQLEPDPEGHFWRATYYSAATCTSDGYAEYVCQIAFNLNQKGAPMDVHTKSEVLPATGHDYETLEDSQPTHARDGRLWQRCRNCGDEIVEIRTGEGHDLEEQSYEAPTCTEPGKRVSVCTVCGFVSEEVIPPSGHRYEVIEDTEATHLEDGRLVERCAVCGDERTEERPAEGHTCEEASVTPPSCTEPGVRIMRCAVCGEETEEEIEAPGHVPEAREDGSVVCSVCGEVLEEAPDTETETETETDAPGDTDTPKAGAEPGTDGTEDTGDAPGTPDNTDRRGMIIGIAAGAVAVLALGAGIAIGVKKSRKAG